jgi:hypothetical protein
VIRVSVGVDSFDSEWTLLRCLVFSFTDEPELRFWSESVPHHLEKQQAHLQELESLRLGMEEKKTAFVAAQEAKLAEMRALDVQIAKHYLATAQLLDGQLPLKPLHSMLAFSVGFAEHRALLLADPSPEPTGQEGGAAHATQAHASEHTSQRADRSRGGGAGRAAAQKDNAAEEKKEEEEKKVATSSRAGRKR